MTDLAQSYRDYIDCLNGKDWAALANFVCEDVCHNGQQIGLAGYRAMLEEDFREIPDLFFRIALLVAGPSVVGSRLSFDCTPVGDFLGLPVNGRKVQFAENVFYAYRAEKIQEVWSVIDRAAIETQLRPRPGTDDARTDTRQEYEE